MSRRVVGMRTRGPTPDASMKRERNPTIPRVLGVFAFAFGRDEFVVLKVPSSRLEARASLTSAERSVTEGLFEGRSYRDMARERGTSPRTVAGQVRSVFKKLGVSSRSELSALLATGRRPDSRNAPSK